MQAAVTEAGAADVGSVVDLADVCYVCAYAQCDAASRRVNGW